MEKHSSDCDEEVFNEDENLCHCDKCVEERDFRLSRFMLKDELDSVREDSKERSTSTAETRPSKLEKRGGKRDYEIARLDRRILQRPTRAPRLVDSSR